MGTVIGAGSALTMGDASKIPQFVAGGAVAGYVAGNTAANVTGRVSGVAKNVLKQPGNVRRAYEEEAYGLNYARNRDIKRQNDIRKKNFMRDDAEKIKYHDMAAKLSKNGNTFSTAQVMDAVWDMKKAGINDEKLQEKILKVEARRGSKIGSSNRDHEKIINIAQEAGAFDRSYIYNYEKRQELEDSFYYNLNSNEKDEEEAMKIFADLQEVGGAEKYMKIRNTNKEKEKRQERRGISSTQDKRKAMDRSANDRKAMDRSADDKKARTSAATNSEAKDTTRVARTKAEVEDRKLTKNKREEDIVKAKGKRKAMDGSANEKKARASKVANSKAKDSTTVAEAEYKELKKSTNRQTQRNNRNNRNNTTLP